MTESKTGTCPNCTREPVKIFQTRKGWLCSKCMAKAGIK